MTGLNTHRQGLARTDITRIEMLTHRLDDIMGVKTADPGLLKDTGNSLARADADIFLTRTDRA